MSIEDHLNPEKNKMIRLGDDIPSTSDVDAGDAGISTDPPIDLERIRAAVKRILTNEFGIQPGVELVVQGFEPNQEWLIGGKRITDAAPEDIEEVLKADRAVTEAEADAERQKYLNPATNPMIKLDFD
jgi:hypothetical protein